MNHAKICNLYARFDTKVEKRVNWVWTEEKRGSLIIEWRSKNKKGGLLTGT